MCKKKIYFHTLICILFLAGFNKAQIKNIQVSSPAANQPEEVSIAINTQNEKQIAAGANITYYFNSDDGGIKWREGNLNSIFGVWGDPCVTFDGLGNLYFAHLSYPDTLGYWIDRIVVQKSTDNGKTWNEGSGIGFNDPKNQDKEWMAVDLSDSPYKNNIYITWTEFDDYGSTDSQDSSRILFSSSSDQGETWSAPVIVSDVSGNCVDSDSTVEGAVPAIGPNGEIYVSWAGPLGLSFDKSTDGGKTWGKDVHVADIPGGWDFNVSGIFRANGLPVTICDTSKAPTRGNIYILWGDQRNGLDNSDVFIVKSKDKGNTWSEPLKVNNDNTERHQFFPWISIDQTTGFLYADFYDRRNTTGVNTDVYLARSTDGGNNFKNYLISDSSFTPKSYIFFGDYSNIAAFNKKIYVIWMRMDGEKLSVWSALADDSTLNNLTNVSPSKRVHLLNYKLEQNYPNPFNPSTVIGYQLSESGFTTLKIYNLLGSEVKTLVNKYQNAGVHEVTFDASGLSSGVYFYRLLAGSFIKTKKLILIR